MAENFDSSSRFEDLGLSPWLIDQCSAMGLPSPTAVQCNCIPKILNGSNCIGVSQTGSGKTLAFALPILQILAEDPYGIFALILTPTRELAIQIAEQFKIIGKPIQLEVSVIIGGMDMVVQGKEISAQPHILIATPGRLADHLKTSSSFSLRRIKFLVLDEADRLLEGQFTEPLQVISKVVPSNKQTLMFSATMPDDIKDINIMPCENPFSWSINSDVSTVEKLDQRYVLVPPKLMRNASLVQIINQFQEQNPDSSIIVFTKNCKWCQLISTALRHLGFENVSLNSTLKQWERFSSILKFKSSKSKLLIATDIASRGLDIPMVDLVINYSVPPVPRNYIHRVGRTARAGKGGLAITFVTPKAIVALKRIEKEINTRLTEHKVSEKKVLNMMVQVEVAFREAEISLDEKDTEERKRINKRKQLIIDGKDNELREIEVDCFAPKKKKKTKRKEKKN